MEEGARWKGLHWILKSWDFYESLRVVKAERDRDNGYQVAGRVAGVGKSGLLSTVAAHVTEGSAETVSTPEAEERAGLRTRQPSAHSRAAGVWRCDTGSPRPRSPHRVITLPSPQPPASLIHSESSFRHNLKHSDL